MTTYLYIKTHNKTGLRYLGKTTNSDPYSYKGSGVRWLNHISKHGYDVTTEIIFESNNPHEIRAKGIYYSNLYDVVKSKDWANLKPETGDLKRKEEDIDFSLVFKWWNNGDNQVLNDTCPGDDFVQGRLPFNNNGSSIGAEKLKGTFWVNNGIDEFMSKFIPEGWTKGRLKKNAFAGGSGRHSAQDSKWWNNGIEERMSIESPGPEFVIGRLLSWEDKYKDPSCCINCNGLIPYRRRKKKTCSIICQGEHRRKVASRPRNRTAKIQEPVLD